MRAWRVLSLGALLSGCAPEPPDPVASEPLPSVLSLPDLLTRAVHDRLGAAAAARGVFEPRGLGGCRDGVVAWTDGLAFASLQAAVDADLGLPVQLCAERHVESVVVGPGREVWLVGRAEGDPVVWQHGPDLPALAVEEGATVHLRDLDLRGIDPDLGVDHALVTMAPFATLDAAHTVFRGHYATVAGGAVQAGAGATLRLRDSAFVDNASSVGAGALRLEQPAWVEVTDTVFERNDSSAGGALVILQDGEGPSHVQVTDCVFDHNRGGAIHATTVGWSHHTGFLRNQHASNQGGDVVTVVRGGTVRMEGVSVTDSRGDVGTAWRIEASERALLVGRDLVLTGNHADRGGAIQADLDDAELRLEGGTFHLNAAPDGAVLQVTGVSPSRVSVLGGAWHDNNGSIGAVLSLGGDVDAAPSRLTMDGTLLERNRSGDGLFEADDSWNIAVRALRLGDDPGSNTPTLWRDCLRRPTGTQMDIVQGEAVVCP